MIFLEFFIWYYSKAPLALLRAWKNFLIFFYHFFGIKYHLATLFRPWHLVQVRFQEASQIKTFLYNVASRIIGSVLGAIVRVITVLTGIGIILCVGILGAVGQLCWVLLPFGAGYFFITGIRLFNLQGAVIAGGSLTIGCFPFIIFLYQRFSRPDKNDDIVLDAYIKKRLGFDWHKQELLEANNISQDDIAYLSEWYRDHHNEEKLRGKFWKKEVLDRVIPIGVAWASGYTPFLDKFSRDINREMFMFDEHSFSLTHRREIELAERMLAQEGRNNVLLVGEEGVGKHFVLRGLEHLIETGRALPELAFKRFVWLDTDAILSGITAPGDLRERVETIFYEAMRAGNIVLAMERLHAFFDPAFPEIPDLFLPFLRSDYSQIVATTTPEFLASAMSRADVVNEFGKITLQEASVKNTFFTLQEVLLSIEKRGALFVPYASLKKIIEIADRFSVDTPRPKKDIDFLEESISYIKSKGKNVLEVSDILEAVSEKTGVPLGSLRQDETEKLLHIEEILHKKLIDQSEAVSAIASALKRARVEIRETDRPIGSFLFLGPTGVGKTTAAKGLAELYFGSERSMIRFDMSEYQNASDSDRLIDTLSSRVKQRPYTLLLLDEIEKAYPKILNLFLQILDEGIFTDRKGSKIDFRNMIIIGTSNAGAEFIRANIGSAGNKSFEHELLDHIQKGGIFTPELLNRFDAVVTFKPLGKEELKSIARLLLEGLAAQLKKEHNITFVITDDLISFLSEEGFDPEYGARPMRRVLQDTIETLIAERLLKGEIKKGDTLELMSSQLRES